MSKRNVVLISGAAALLACSGALARGETTVVTTGAVTGINVFPLGSTSNQAERYQQVYDWSLFASLTGPVTIHAIAFRTTAVDGGTTRSIDLTLNVSSTDATPTSMSINYDANVGGEPQTVVYDDTFIFTTAGDGTFDVVIHFDTPYTLEPGRNILLDYDTDSISGGGVGFEFHANSPTTGRVYTSFNGQTFFGVNQGLLTMFMLDVGGGGACVGDLDGDNDVDFADLNTLLGQFNSTGPDLSGDLDDDGDVDFGDLNLLLGVFSGGC